jgi:hypothetical protein
MAAACGAIPGIHRPFTAVFQPRNGTHPQCNAESELKPEVAIVLDQLLPSRVYGELPSGDTLVPGLTHGCPGPTARAACPLNRTVIPRPCADAIWYLPGERGWRTVFPDQSSVCPVSALDPLGPPPTPLD